MSRADEHKGAKCGIATIDLKFKEWLHDVLQVESNSSIMRTFRYHRKKFGEDEGAREFNVPGRIGYLEIPGRLENGLVRITRLAIISRHQSLTSLVC